MEGVGVVAVEVYFPSLCVSQQDLERYDGVEEGKYTIGLGQTNMAFASEREDICSMSLTVVKQLMDKYCIEYHKIGRLEVGTESMIDKSKSVKSHLMALFEESGNHSVEGVDNVNACYGGTAALFNSINWIESSSWDGRYALVVAGDVAVYAPGPARATGGCGVVAMLLGPNAPLVFETGTRGVHMEHAYDFYKPVMSSEYPVVDGKFSIQCYMKALDKSYQEYKRKWKAKTGNNFTISKCDYVLLHSPFTKLVQKGSARMLFHDFLDNPDDAQFSSVQKFKDIPVEQTYINRDIEQSFITLNKANFEEKVAAGLYLPKELGNLYCGSLYSCFVSLLDEKCDELLGKKILFYSYGSGLAASIFSIHVRSSVANIATKLNLKERMSKRVRVSPEQFTTILQAREDMQGAKSYQPSHPIDHLFPNTYYLANIDAQHRREYQLRPNKKVVLGRIKQSKLSVTTV